MSLADILKGKRKPKEEEQVTEETMSAKELEKFTSYCARTDNDELMTTVLEKKLSYSDGLEMAFTDFIERMEDVCEKFDEVPNKSQGGGEMTTFVPKDKNEAVLHMKEQNPKLSGKELFKATSTAFPELFKIPKE